MSTVTVQRDPYRHVWDKKSALVELLLEHSVEVGQPSILHCAPAGVLQELISCLTHTCKDLSVLLQLTLILGWPTSTLCSSRSSTRADFLSHTCSKRIIFQAQHLSTMFIQNRKIENQRFLQAWSASPTNPWKDCGIICYNYIFYSYYRWLLSECNKYQSMLSLKYYALASPGKKWKVERTCSKKIIGVFG
jgi:hypothetical protein